MYRVGLSFIVLCILSGCTAITPGRPALQESELLSGDALFGAPVGPPAITESDALAMDEDMRAFVHEHTGGVRSAEARLRRLWRGMEDRGLFALEYTPDVTRSVRDTFHSRQGNCLSFTMLFVKLAREAGLEASYQMVDMPPAWSIGSDVVVVSTHINVLVNTERNMSYVVDFNVADFRGNYDRRLVSDRYAMALFYANLGAEAFIGEDYETSFSFLRAAIETYPDVVGAWVNLGLLYWRHGMQRHAEAAYLHALAREPRNRSAMTNLANLYAATGEEERAQEYRRRIRHYQDRNPYYHYSLARRAHEEQRTTDALEALRRAVRLKPDEHQFHFLRALAYEDLGRRQDARDSLLRARELVEFADIEERYAAKLDLLAR